MGSYKFDKFKSSPEFIKELEIFHFGENRFHRNDSQGKVTTHRALLKVNFEYVDYVDKDEEVYRNVCNMTALNKKPKRKTIIIEVKGSSSNNPEPKGREEQAIRKSKQDTARRLEEGARKFLAE